MLSYCLLQVHQHIKIADSGTNQLGVRLPLNNLYRVFAVSRHPVHGSSLHLVEIILHVLYPANLLARDGKTSGFINAFDRSHYIKARCEISLR
jgi:hypothetical protein